MMTAASGVEHTARRRFRACDSSPTRMPASAAPAMTAARITRAHAGRGKSSTRLPRSTSSSGSEPPLVSELPVKRPLGDRDQAATANAAPAEPTPAAAHHTLVHRRHWEDPAAITAGTTANAKVKKARGWKANDVKVSGRRGTDAAPVSDPRQTKKATAETAMETKPRPGSRHQRRALSRRPRTAQPASTARGAARAASLIVKPRKRWRARRRGAPGAADGPAPPDRWPDTPSAPQRPWYRSCRRCSTGRSRGRQR